MFQHDNEAEYITSVIKAYIPLRRKTIRIGSWCWLVSPKPQRET